MEREGPDFKKCKWFVVGGGCSHEYGKEALTNKEKCIGEDCDVYHETFYDESLAEARKRKVVCDVCGALIDSKEFRVVCVFRTNREDKFFHESMSDMEKEIIACDDCIENLNFKPYKEAV